ncbi:hypothetical protein CIPAW_01G285200 [Carya illinoinensis]|uniref:Uncharacterized protein n=1 Tax=Carya illinoinensis TaxID=32201 RepID=A0A8T1RTI8_CARIL|nr:hypothetical protein CIPAW_01G285200 [Carya illinoinensis]
MHFRLANGKDAIAGFYPCKDACARLLILSAHNIYIFWEPSLLSITL